MENSGQIDRGSDPNESVRCVTLVATPEESRHARLMIRSLRRFGGALAACQVTVFVPEDFAGDQISDHQDGVEVLTFPDDSSWSSYPFFQKVRACAEAEKSSGRKIRTLVWFNPETFIVKPPRLLILDATWKAAFRPVHIQNVGSSIDKPPDDYWREIVDSIGMNEPNFSIESFIDGKRLRPYFNTHLFAIDPDAGILQRWLEIFLVLASNTAFQNASCQDPLHRIFLHQAVLSTLVSNEIPQDHIRILPPDYSYPLHLQERVPISRRIKRLEDLTCAVYEDDDSLPLHAAGLEIGDPLRSWIEESITG